MYGKTYMRFNIRENKEYIYSRGTLDNSKTSINNIGKTFIDFLANSDEIIKVIEEQLYTYNKEKKLGENSELFTIAKFKLEKLNTIFKFFDFDSYIEEYVKNLRNDNNIKIHNCLETIKKFEKDIEKYQSKEYYNDLVKDEISWHHDYDSEQSKKGFYYLDEAGKSINELIKKYENIYKRKIPYNIRKKIYEKNKKYSKGIKIIDEIDRNIYTKYEQEIRRDVEKGIQNDIKRTKKFIKSYKNFIKHYVRDNERELEEVFVDFINQIKFWVSFSRYILISFYDLSLEKYDTKFSPTQRLLDYLLHIQRTLFDQNLTKIPQSEITLELDDGKDIIDLYKFMEKNRKNLFGDYDNKCYSKISNYKVNMIQEYSIKSIEDFLSVSLIQILQNNIKICRCENCDNLFISVKKSNEKYCTYNFKGKKTCRDLSYSIYLQKNQLSNILRKKYRTENAKKNRNKHIPRIEDKFQEWYVKAKEQKILCEKGKITIDDFKKWFEDNKKWF